MGTTFFIISVIIIGFFIGKFSANKDLLKINDYLITILLYLLLFTFGIGFGLNKELFDLMDQLGWEILILTLGGIIGSVILAGILGKHFLEDMINED